MRKPLINFSIQHPIIVFSIVLLITAFFGYQLTGITIDTDPENMLPADEPVRVFNDEVKEDFGISDFIAVGVVREGGAFTKEQLERIYHITEDIAEIEGVVVEDIMAPSMVDDIRQGGGNSIVVEPLMGDSPADDEEARYILERIKENPVLRGKLASDDGKALALFIPIEAKDMSHRIAGEIKAITDKYGGDETYHIAGLPVAEDSFGKEMFNQMIYSAPLAGLIIFLLMLMFFRNALIILPPMIVAVVSIVWTMGFLVLSGNTVHIMSSMIPIFLFPIAVLNSIHILSEFYDRYGKYKHKDATLRATIAELFKPMLFTSATTVVGFISLISNNIPPVQVFGLFVAFGVASSWLLSVTLNPAFAMLLPDKALRNFGGKDEDQSKAILSRILYGIRSFTQRHYRVVLGAATVVIIISAVGLSKIEVNDNPVKWFKADHPMRIADQELNKHLAGTYMNYLVIDGGEENALKDPKLLAYIEKLQRHLEKNPIVGATAGITDIVKKVRFELLGGEDRSLYALPETREEVGQFLFMYEMSGGDPDDLFKLVTSDYTEANLWVQLTAGDNQTVSKVVTEADQFIADNPPPVDVDYHWAGLPYVNVVWQEKMVSGMRISLLMAFGIVFVMMVFLFRSPVLGLISMLPLTITIMAIYAAIGFAGKPYDMPVAVLSSLTLGLSIDFAIHFIQRSRAIHERTGDFKDTFTKIFEGPGRAISRNVLVIAIGFVPMFFSNLVPYVTVGTFFFAIMMVSGTVTLFLLPSLSILLKKKLFPAAAEAELTEPKTKSNKEAGVMKTSIITLLVFSVLLAAGHPLVAADMSAQDIMKKSHMAYYYAADDGVADVTMTIAKKGKERIREFVMLRLDQADGGEQKYYTYFKKPSDVSRLTFMVWKNPEANDQRWLYVPSVDLVKQISADDKNSSFVGSDFTYEDVSGRHWTEDTHTLVSSEESLDGKAAYLISSKPVEEYKGFAEKKTWVCKESFLPLKEEYFDKKGKLIRVFTAAKIEVIDDIPTVTVRKMEDIKKNQVTTVQFDKISYNAGIEDNIFTERFLKNPPREFIK